MGGASQSLQPCLGSGRAPLWRPANIRLAAWRCPRLGLPAGLQARRGRHKASHAPYITVCSAFLCLLTRRATAAANWPRQQGPPCACGTRIALWYHHSSIASHVSGRGRQAALSGQSGGQPARKVAAHTDGAGRCSQTSQGGQGASRRGWAAGPGAAVCKHKGCAGARKHQAGGSHGVRSQPQGSGVVARGPCQHGGLPGPAVHSGLAAGGCRRRVGAARRKVGARSACASMQLAGLTNH